MWMFKLRIRDGVEVRICIRVKAIGVTIMGIGKTLEFEHWNKAHFLLNICRRIMCCSINVIMEKLRTSVARPETWHVHHDWHAGATCHPTRPPLSSHKLAPRTLPIPRIGTSVMFIIRSEIIHGAQTAVYATFRENLLRYVLKTLILGSVLAK